MATYKQTLHGDMHNHTFPSCRDPMWNAFRYFLTLFISLWKLIHATYSMQKQTTIVNEPHPLALYMHNRLFKNFSHCSIFSSVMQYKFPSSWVFFYPWSNIVDLSLQNYPAVIVPTMLKHLLSGKNDFGFLFSKIVRSVRCHDK